MPFTSVAASHWKSPKGEFRAFSPVDAKELHRGCPGYFCDANK